MACGKTLLICVLLLITGIKCKSIFDDIHGVNVNEEYKSAKDEKKETFLKLDEQLQNVFSEINILEDTLKSKIKDEDAKNETDIMSTIINVNEKIGGVEGSYESDIKGVDPTKMGYKRNAVTDRNLLWNTKDVAYVLNTSLSSSKKQSIQKAHAAISKISCVKFHLKTNSDKYFLKYFSGGGCYSYVGKHNWLQGQPISIGNGCGSVGIAIHETLHALGFYHEQSRSDRDEYVEIFWENIYPNVQHNFNKYGGKWVDAINTAYDYDGVMHYSKYAFSKNGKPTILALKNPGRALGQRTGLSDVDADQLYKLYDCTNTVAGWSKWSEWHPCYSDCKTKRTRFCYGSSCDGKSTESRICTPSECKVDGHWGRWSSWSCNAKECAEGVQTRTRSCVDPSPHGGGKTCIGQSSESSPCKRGCPNSCSFESFDACGYKLSGSWVVTSGSTPSAGTGPDTDYSGNGHYVYMEATGISSGFKSSLVSSLKPAASSCSFHFKYHMYGSVMGKLDLIIMPQNKMLWSKTGNQGNKWLDKSLLISSSSPYTIKFVATRGSSFRGDIALDNLVFDKKSCTGVNTPPPPPTTTTTAASPSPVTTTTIASPPGKTTTTAPPPGTTTMTAPPPGTTTSSILPIKFACNFEVNKCNMTETTKLKWSFTNTRTSSFMTGPEGDRSSERGRYAFLEASGQRKGDTAILESPFLQANGKTQCLEFFYSMYGSQMGEFVLFMESKSGIKKEMFRKSGNQGKDWKQGHFNFKENAGSFWKLSFTAIRGSGYRSDIALDDIYIHSQECKPEPTPTIMACSFARSMCSWNSNGKFKWRRHSRSTASYSTGPKYALTGYRDYYIYMEVSFIRKEMDFASLDSPVLYSSDPTCMSFYANMHGKDIGTLAVHITEEETGKEMIAFSKTGEHSENWFQVMVDLPVDKKSRMHIKGMIGNGPKGDIAIDNIFVSYGSCKRTVTLFCDFQSSCNDMKVVKTDKRCEFKKSTEMVESVKNTFMNVTYSRCKVESGTGTSSLIVLFSNIAPRGSCLSFKYKIPFVSQGATCRISVYQFVTSRSGDFKMRKFYMYDGAENMWLSRNVTLQPQPLRHTEKISFELYLSKYCQSVGIDDIKVTDAIC